MKKTFFVFMLIISACTQKKTSDGEPLSEQSDTSQTDSVSSMKIKTIKNTDLKTGPDLSTPVISNAQKFILPVPAFKQGGEPLVYPKEDPKAGQQIVDYEGKPIGKSGIVFFNYKDKSWQAAAGDGKGVIIINEVTQEQAEKLDAEISKLHSNPADLTLNELKDVISFAKDKLKLDDMYNSTRTFIKEKMTPVLTEKDSKKNKDEAYGFKKRDDRDINQAIYVPGEFVFEGPAASPQKFKNGGVIVEQGGKMRGVQPDIFIRTYKLANGTAIQALEKDIKSQLN
ncbi:hypothetical protein [Dyadobacter sp. NIV53]|uniref:hypothetical protein n=1 Tax=Dyadobacter sp. NIV53 TaxID=2861765 RepID=UPI001C88C3A8|nr:hypothetical protein [Dyadobacter sp. NIV53]